MKTLYTISATAMMILNSITTFSNAVDSSHINTEITIEIKTITHPTCNHKSDGSITIEVKGGKTPYHYNWNTFPVQTTMTATNLKSGIYFVEITDAAGRIAFRSVELLDPITTLVKEEITATNQNHVVAINSTTHEDNLIISLNDVRVINEKSLTNLDVGIHKLEIQNQQNCIVTQYIQIIEISETAENEIVLTPLELTEEESMVVTK